MDSTLVVLDKYSFSRGGCLNRFDCSKFYNRSKKAWLQDENIEMYSTNSEEKSVDAERFIRTSMSVIYKYVTAISKNVYIDKLDDIVNKYNNADYRTIKMKPIDVKASTDINFDVKSNNKDPNLKLVIM